MVTSNIANVQPVTDGKIILQTASACTINEYHVLDIS